MAFSFENVVNELERYVDSKDKDNIVKFYINNQIEFSKEYLRDISCKDVPEGIRGLYKEIAENSRQNSLDVRIFINELCLNRMNKLKMNVFGFLKTRVNI